MRLFKLSAAMILTFSLFLSACNQNRTQEVANADTNINANVNTNSDANMLANAEEWPEESDPWAKDNLDLQRVGTLLQDADNPQEFEASLNARDGVNNLDLNGDGYVDYISVREYDDRGDGERGLSLFTRFGPDLIQEIATVILYRDDLRAPGARILLRGDDRIYGDNYYYETNWLDRALSIASFLFSPREVYYNSPYYYDYYPPGYVVYDVVPTPFYRTRIERLYPSPFFVYTTHPVFIDRIKIKSPNNGLHLGQIKARLMKPTRAQIEFRRGNPGRGPKGDKPEKGGPGKGPDKEVVNDKKVDASKPGGPPKETGKPDDKGKPAKADSPGKQGGKPADTGGGKGKGKGKP
jgi:hypothetical protein